MVRSILRLATALLLLLQPAAPLSAHSPAQFRVTVEEVLVDVLVTRSGRPLMGLLAPDFTLLDEGERREIRLVAPEDQSLSVLFVMDLSESVTPGQRRRLAWAAERFANQLSDRDRCAIGFVASRFTLLRDFSGCTTMPPGIFPDLSQGGGTALWDSLLMSAALADEEAGRPLVILFTDGVDTASWTPEPFVRLALRGSDTVLYVVAPSQVDGAPKEINTGSSAFEWLDLPRGQNLGIRRLSAQRVPDELASALSRRHRRMRMRSSVPRSSGVHLLRRVARASGGRLLTAQDEERLASAYETILDEMRSRYLLAFRPDPRIPAGWRRLKVTVRTGGTEIEARGGYWHHGARE